MSKMGASIGVPKGKTERDEEERWRIESDVRTLKDAEMIKADPERMKKAKAMIDEEMKAMAKARGQAQE